jgi:hypothetical protein
MSTVVADVPQSELPHRDLRKVAGIALVCLLVLGLGFSIFQNMKLNNRVAELESGLTGAQGELKKALASSDNSLTNQVQDLELALNDIQAGNSQQMTALTKDTKRLSKQLGLINDCLPELQDQMFSFEVSFGYAYPERSPSRYCSPLLYGSEAAGGE